MSKTFFDRVSEKWKFGISPFGKATEYIRAASEKDSDIQNLMAKEIENDRDL